MRSLLVGLAVLLPGSVAAWTSPAAQDASGGASVDGGASIPVFFAWPKAHLRVVLVPPVHGPLYTGLPPDGMSAPLEVISDRYVRASLQAMEDWDRGIDLYTADHPEHAWLRGISWDVVVASAEGAGSLPEEASAADVLVLYQETLGPVLGLTWNGVRPHPLGIDITSPHPVCVINNAMWLGYSLSAADMHNIHGHEFGHCLGLLHADHPHDLLDSEYDHWPTPAQELHCVSNLDIAGLTLSFGEALGHPTNATRVHVASWAPYDLRPTCEAPG